MSEDDEPWIETMNKYTKRRKRRRANAKLKNPNSVRVHRELGGRTGQVQEKRTPQGKVFYFAMLNEVPHP